MSEDTIWALIDFEPPKKAAPVIKGCCPKCGKPLGKGGHFHIRACKGISDAD